MCQLFEANDIGFMANSIAEITASSENSCTTSITIRASDLAINFLVRFLADFEGWNKCSSYSRDVRRASSITYGAVAMSLPPGTSKNVCSAPFARLCKLSKTELDDTDRRFWWTRVERLENLIFMWILNKLRLEVRKGLGDSAWSSNVLATLMKEETRTLNKNGDLRLLVKRWKEDMPKKYNKQSKSAHKQQQQQQQEQQQEQQEQQQEQQQQLELNTISHGADLKKLRLCNFPPRMLPNLYETSWEPRASFFLSGVVFDPIANLPLAPRGMHLSDHCCLLKSIW